MAFGLLLCGLADIQFGALRREEGGTEAATALVGLAYVLVGSGLLMLDARLADRMLLSWLFAMATLAFAAGAWRWGMRVCAAVAGVSFFLLLTQGPAPRLLWIVASSMLIPPLRAAGEYPRLPRPTASPSRRFSASRSSRRTRPSTWDPGTPARSSR